MPVTGFLACVMVICCLLPGNAGADRKRTETRAQGRRISRLERMVYEESIEFRKTLLDISSTMEGMQECCNKSVHNTCPDGEKHSTIDSKTTIKHIGDGDITALLSGIQDEKDYVRSAIKHVQLDNERLVQRTEFLQSFEKTISESQMEIERLAQSSAQVDSFQSNITDRLTEDKGEIMKEIAICNNMLSTLKETIDAMNVELMELKQTCATGIVKKCETPWIRFQDSCYYLSSETGNWEEARNNCSILKAYLVEINNEQEETFLLRTIPETPELGNAGPWIGGSDQDIEGEWRWSSSGKLIGEGYSDWHQNEPNGGTSENCLNFQLKYSFFKWNDLSCHYKLRYICEK